MLKSELRLCDTDLRDEELGDSFGQFAFLAGQDHLQHIAVQLLHNNEHSLRCLEHALQVDDAGVMQILGGGHNAKDICNCQQQKWRAARYMYMCQGVMVVFYHLLMCSGHYLQYGHLVSQLALLLGWKSHLVNDLDGNISATLSVFA